MDMTADIKNTIAVMERKFHRACNQIVLLNRHIDNLQLRYDRAHRDNRRTFRIKLSALEGVRNMYVEFASMKADELMDLQCQLLEQTTLSSEDSESEEEFDDNAADDDTQDEEMQ